MRALFSPENNVFSKHSAATYLYSWINKRNTEQVLRKVKFSKLES